MSKDWNTFLFLTNYDPEVMATPSKIISLVIQEYETPVGFRRKRKKHKDEEKGKHKIRDQVPLEQEQIVSKQRKKDEGPDLEIIEVTGSKKIGRKMKVKMLVFTQETIEKDMPINPITKYVAREIVLVSEYLPQTYPRIYEPREANKLQEVMHYKEQRENKQVEELRAQVKEAQETIGKLREENKEMNISIYGHMYVCEDVLFKSKIMARKTLPQHRQVKNLYMQKRALKAEIRAL